MLPEVRRIADLERRVGALEREVAEMKSPVDFDELQPLDTEGKPAEPTPAE